MAERPIVQSVPVKMYRSDGILTVAAPMPGLDADVLGVEVTAQGTLVIQGSLKGALDDGKELLLHEWSVGPYHREVPLPVPVDATAATVTYGNGVLVVALPVIEGATRPALVTLDRVTATRARHVPPGDAATTGRA